MAVSGMESMFRAMGLGQVLDMAKAMAENGTFDKMLKFVDEAESLRLKVEELIDEVKQMRRENAALLGINPKETSTGNDGLSVSEQTNNSAPYAMGQGIVPRLKPDPGPSNIYGTAGYDFRHSDGNAADCRD